MTTSDARRLVLAAAVSVAVALTGCSTGITGSAPTPSPTLIGSLNPAVTQATIDTTICVPGWTRTVRPPVSFTNRVKRAQLPVGADLKAFEEDHLMPLALGGAPRELANLRPVPWPVAKRHDRDEVRLHDEVCDGEVTLAAARAEMSRI